VLRSVHRFVNQVIANFSFDSLRSIFYSKKTNNFFGIWSAFLKTYILHCFWHFPDLKKMLKIKVMPLSTFRPILDCEHNTAKHVPSEKDKIMVVISYINKRKN